MSRGIVIVWHAAVVDDYFDFILQLARESPESQLVAFIPAEWPEVPGQKNVLPKRFDHAAPNLKILRVKTLFTGNIKIFLYLTLFFELLVQRKIKWDLIYIEEPYMLSSVQLLFLKMFMGNRLQNIWGFSAQNIHKQFWFPIRFLERLVLKNIDRMLVMSRASREIYRAKGFRGGFFDFPLGNSERLNTAGMNSWVTKGSKSENGALVCVYYGRLTSAKGIDDIIHIADILSSEGLKIIFRIAGGGEMMSDVISLSKRNSNVEFVGTVSRENLPAFLASADLNLLLSKSTPGWSEQFGRSIVEAKAFGVPTLAYRSGEIPAVVNDEECIVDCGDFLAISKMIRRFSEDPELLMGKKRKVIAQAEKYTWQSVARRLAIELQE